jgi:hypothetical protein
MPDLKEIRELIQFVFVISGGTIGLIAFFQSLRQRRLENALKMIALFKESLGQDDLERWAELFRASSELAGAKPGYYVFGNTQIPISNYFSEGSHDNGAIARMAESLEIICFEINHQAVDSRIIWFELGQLMRTMYSWLETAPYNGSTLITQYPSIEKTFKRYKHKFEKWPSRVFAYAE